TYACGTCTAPATCGGSGSPNICGTPRTVVLDAVNTSTTDVAVSTNGTQPRQFAVGVVVRGVTTSDYLRGVYFWRFTLRFDPSKLTVQGAPSAVAVSPP